MSEPLAVREAWASYVLDVQRVRTGYKQTEVGVIPQDWVVSSLESVTPSNIKNGIVDGPFGSNLKTIHYRNSGVPIITSGYVTNGKFQANKYLYVDQAKFQEEKRSAVKPGDIVMAKIGERCGASAILPTTHEMGILSGNALKITVDLQRHSPFFIWQVLWDLYSSGEMEVLRTVGAQPAISMANLKKHKLPLPPTKAEQEAIAEALGDADALIEALEQLITKKRHLKQGAMQELLTGKNRLPGFCGEWEVRRLGEVATFYKGKGLPKSELNADGKEPCIHYGELFTRYPETIREIISYTNISDAPIRSVANDVLMPTSDVTPRGLAKASCVTADGVILGGDILVIRSDAKLIFGPFLSYLIRYEEKQVLQFVTGSTVFHLYGADMKKFIFSMPSLTEQTAIATILTDMDTEIAALEQQLAKARGIKQGMMQELLTGKIRLV